MAIMDKTMLRSDGDSMELPNGQVLRLRVIHDDFYSINDESDYLGRIEWVSVRDVFPGRRPAWCDGSAEIIDRDGSSRLWWQPPSDVKGNAEIVKRLRAQVKLILAYGYNVYMLELCEGRDAYGNLIVINVESLSGVEPTYEHEYIDSIVNDLMTNLGVMTNA